MTDVGLEATGLLTVGEVATRLRFSEQTIRRLIDRERKHPGTGLESVREGRAVRVTPEAVIAYKDRLRAEARRSAA
jgi:excisionase family DNA binding protein